MLKEKLDDLIFSVVDLETTGLSSNKNEIVEICIVTVSGREIKDEWNTLVQPSNLISFKITRIHGITNDMIMTAPEKYEVLPILKKKLKNTILVEHNMGGFDSRFLTKFIGEKVWRYEVNTIKMAKFLNPKLRSYKLKNLSNFYGVKLSNHHQALSDTIATARIFIKMLNILYEDENILKGFIHKNKIFQEIIL